MGARQQQKCHHCPTTHSHHRGHHFSSWQQPFLPACWGNVNGLCGSVYRFRQSRWTWSRWWWRPQRPAGPSFGQTPQEPTGRKDWVCPPPVPPPCWGFLLRHLRCWGWVVQWSFTHMWEWKATLMLLQSTHTYTCMHALTHIRTHTHTHTHTHAYACMLTSMCCTSTHTHTQTHTHTHAHTHKHTHIHSHIYFWKQVHCYSYAPTNSKHTRTHTHTHTHTHTQTHTHPNTHACMHTQHLPTHTQTCYTHPNITVSLAEVLESVRRCAVRGRSRSRTLSWDKSVKLLWALPGRLARLSLLHSNHRKFMFTDIVLNIQFDHTLNKYFVNELTSTKMSPNSFTLERVTCTIFLNTVLVQFSSKLQMPGNISIEMRRNNVVITANPTPLNFTIFPHFSFFM